MSAMDGWSVRPYPDTAGERDRPGTCSCRAAPGRSYPSTTREGGNCCGLFEDDRRMGPAPSLRAFLGRYPERRFTYVSRSVPPPAPLKVKQNQNQ